MIFIPVYKYNEGELNPRYFFDILGAHNWVEIMMVVMPTGNKLSGNKKNAAIEIRNLLHGLNSILDTTIESTSE